jgi:hypothetical protein
MKTFLAMLISSFISVVSYSQHTDTSFYSVVGTGTIKGVQKMWQEAPNEFQYIYHFNDRGRGDSVSGVLKTNQAGLIGFLDVKGLDYHKNSYHEHYEVLGDSAIYSVNGSRKAKKFDDQWYRSTAIPGFKEAELRWLLQKGKQGKLVAGNEIHIGQPLLYHLSFNGKSATVKLYAFYSDTIPVPEYAWFTNDDRFFASIDYWTGIVQKGYESWTDSLLMLQEQASTDIYVKQMKQLSENLPAQLLITHATLFDAPNATVQKDMTIEVVKGVVKAIYPSTEKRHVKVDSVIDAGGKFVMPGLWDMHAHYFKSDGVGYLAGGVTHVRDMGNNKLILLYRREVAANRLLGPDISFTSGFLDQQGPFQGPVGKIVATLEEAKAAVYEFKRDGYNQVKLYSSIDPKWVAPVASLAHANGLRVAGHIPAYMTAAQAVRDGYDELTHMNYIFLNFMSDTLDTRSMVRFKAVAAEGAKINLNSPEILSFIQLLKQRNVSVDPTMNVFSQMFTEFKGDTVGYLKPIIGWLPASMSKELVVETPFAGDDKKTVYRQTYSNMLRMLKLLYDNNIMIVPGTDGGIANALHHELELYVRADIPPAQVLKIATYNAAKDCGLADRYGAIQAGRVADFILIDGNPANHIEHVRRVEWVIKNGKLYRPKQLLASQGWKYYY